eukprot:TRINITY_DN50130_c0_g2_i1.p1 TRINITY_DN50130_c0_g2~~TRINITY_DN50130_c0_g2_i1.p1  ORF type:complete len:116 (+),score=7.85 TRINITY_DN50130_c0_g2_i1:158-505(+)
MVTFWLTILLTTTDPPSFWRRTIAGVVSVRRSHSQDCEAVIKTLSEVSHGRKHLHPYDGHSQRADYSAALWVCVYIQGREQEKTSDSEKLQLMTAYSMWVYQQTTTFHFSPRRTS